MRFLADVRGKLGEIAHQCEAQGRETQSISLDDLPLRLGQPHTTAAELIDEYYWMTLTGGVTPPEPATLEKWLEWSSKT